MQSKKKKMNTQIIIEGSWEGIWESDSDNNRRELANRVVLGIVMVTMIGFFI